ncbi:hypothetical protein [Castellaniella sp. S9]|uniref:hypothetical protein n=1 Tax=Castellaniella sp. S9 TaxID=2993652 RepID=UPI0022B2E43E|nr:hypothetical protein [Castellaniella sp. S9]
MQFTDRPSELKGVFEIQIYRAGRLVDAIREDNLIVNGAKSQLARLVGGDGALRHIQKIGFGTGTAAANPNDTALTSAYIKNLSGHSYPTTGRVQFSWALSNAEANGKSITEFGLICADNTLFSRKVRAPISKDDDISLTGTWTIIF